MNDQTGDALTDDAVNIDERLSDIENAINIVGDVSEALCKDVKALEHERDEMRAVVERLNNRVKVLEEGRRNDVVYISQQGSSR